MTVRQSEIEIIVSKCVEATILAMSFREGDEDILPKLEAELRDVVRDELMKAGVPVQRKRKAIVTSPSAGQHHPLAILDTVSSYLPSNFTACESSGTIHGDCILIEGFDRAGWTLDAYVIPRLASGLIVAKEVK
jgi:hypothetical protein